MACPVSPLNGWSVVSQHLRNKILKVGLAKNIEEGVFKLIGKVTQPTKGKPGYLNSFSETYNI